MITAKRRRQLDQAFMAGVRNCLNLVGRECHPYRLAEGQADLRRAFERGWDWARDNVQVAGVMLQRLQGPS